MDMDYNISAKRKFVFFSVGFVYHLKGMYSKVL